MRVAHIIDDYSAANGGLTTALQQLTASLSPLGVTSTVYCVGSSTAAPATDCVSCRPAALGGSFNLSTELFHRLGRELASFDVVHIHGIWRAPQLTGLYRARAAQLATVVSPHNMLGGWLWRRSWPKRLKKNLYWASFRHLFRGAARVHALSPVEAETLKEFFPNTPIDVIPNGINLDPPAFHFDGTIPPYFLYLGRLFPGKGIELVIDAFAKFARRSEFRLILAGASSNPGYEQKLHSLVCSLGIGHRVEWPGHVAGVNKTRLLSQATAVFLPSFSEGVSMVALETLAAATPLVASREVGVADVGNHGGLVVELNPESLHQAMDESARWQVAERLARGALCRELALSTYSWTHVAPQFRALYERTVKHG
jgi:glycosyltransferase involved in cell wall biosynthesis